jgi:hypothetical protein
MRSVNLPFNVSGTPAVSQQLDNTGGQVRRLSVRETTGTAGAIFELYDGSGVNGTLIDTIALSAGQSTRDYYRLHEYPYFGGLYLDVISGDITGLVVVGHSPNWDAEGEPVVIIGSLDINVTG